MILKLFLLLLPLSAVSAVSKCCDGPENKLVNKKCPDGNSPRPECSSSKVALNFEQEDAQYLLNANKELKVFYKSGDTEVFAEGRYCFVNSSSGDETALVCTADDNKDEENWLARGICFIISVVFMVLTIAVYLFLPNLRDLQGKCTLYAITGLTFAFIVIGILQFRSQLARPYCKTVAFLQYFFFMFAFIWLNITSFHIWKTTVLSFLYTNYRRTGMLGTRKQWLRIYYAYGFGGPFLFLIITLITDLVDGNHIKPNMGLNQCWFSENAGLWAYFYGPIAALLLLNTILFVWTMKILWKDVENQNIALVQVKSARYKCILYLKLFVIMGLTWIFELFSAIFYNPNSWLNYFWILVDYINGLQGILIFLILILFRKRALRGLSKRKVFGFSFPRSWLSLDDEEGDQEEYTNVDGPNENGVEDQELNKTGNS